MQPVFIPLMTPPQAVWGSATGRRMMICLQEFRPFLGLHCETSTMGNMLLYQGVFLSEPLLFGIGEGLYFLTVDQVEAGSDIPILSGRINANLVSRNIARNLGLELCSSETESPDEAWAHLAGGLADNQVVGVKLDTYYLKYFRTRRHFSAHFVAVYGYDDRQVYIVDTISQGGPQKVLLDDFGNARNSRQGYQYSKNLSFIARVKRPIPDLIEPVKTAIANCARHYLENVNDHSSYRGIQQTAEDMKRWLDLPGWSAGKLEAMGHFWENAGTGGANFRRLYAEFLRYAFSLIGFRSIEKAAALIEMSACDWTEAARCLKTSSEDGGCLARASEALLRTADYEVEAMKLLRGV